MKEVSRLIRGQTLESNKAQPNEQWGVFQLSAVASQDEVSGWGCNFPSFRRQHNMVRSNFKGDSFPNSGKEPQYNKKVN